MSVMSPEQCRTARAWMGWAQEDLVNASGVAIQNIYKFENGDPPTDPMDIMRRNKTVSILQQALERAGVRFSFRHGNPIGIHIGSSVPGREARRGFLLTRELCRAGRAWLDWTQQDLSDFTEFHGKKVSLSTIRDFENNRLRRNRRYQPLPQNLAAMQAALVAQGIIFLFDPDGRPIGIECAERRKQAAA